MTFDIKAFFAILIFLIFWIQLPGMLLMKRLLPSEVSAATRHLSAFFGGAFIAAGLYAVESLTGLPLLLAEGPLLSICAIAFYYKKHKGIRPAIKFRPTYFVLFAGIYILSVLSFQLRYVGAVEGTTTQVFHDYLFHTGNIAALSRSFPAVDIRVSSLTFYYHYFTDLFFAMAKHVFGTEAFAIYMNGNALVAAWPLSLALIVVGDRITEGGKVKEKNYLVACGGLFVSCICLLFINVKYQTFPLSWMDNHFFTNGNSLAITVAVHILLLELLAIVWDKAYSNRYAALFLLLTLVATTVKGTTGALVVAAIWAVFIVELVITRQFKKQKLIYGIASTLGFLAAYLFVVAGFTTSGSNNRTVSLDPIASIAATRVGQVLNLLGVDYSTLPITLLACIMCAIFMVGPFVLPFAGFVVKKCKPLFKEKAIGDIYDWFAIGTVIMGLVGFCLLAIPGFSQGYMVITGAPFIFYCSMSYIWSKSPSIGDRVEAVPNQKATSQRKCKDCIFAFIKKWTYCFMGIGCLMLLCDIAFFIKTDLDAQKVYASQAGDADDLVDSDTMAAYFWLRDNTDENAIIAVDRITENLDYREIFFYASAFSERQCYLEGYDYSSVSEDQVAAMKDINERFYSEDADIAESAMDINYIDYLVVTKHSHPDYEPTSPRLQLVFSNDSVEIYEFLRYE